jgi:thymidylate kinase
VTILACVWGTAPGTGKSTLCSALSAVLAEAGLRVDHFREEEILTRPEFADVAAEFRQTGAVTMQALLTSSARFADAIRADGADVVIADALAPYVPTLLALGHGDQEIAAFTTKLARTLCPVSPVLIYLDGNAGTALARAAEREGPQWLDSYIGKLARYQVRPQVRDLASAIGYLRRERAVTLAAAHRMGWPLVLVHGATELSPAQVLATAQQGLRPWLAEHRTRPPAADAPTGAQDLALV